MSPALVATRERMAGLDVVPMLVAPWKRVANLDVPQHPARPGFPGARFDVAGSVRCGPAAPGRASMLLAHVERLDGLHVGGVEQCQRAGPAVGRGLHGDRATGTDCGPALQTAETM